MSFDALAPHYRWMEFLLAGEKLQRCRTAFLDKIPRARSILLAGEGHGRCLIECCQHFANAQVTYLDASEGMLTSARRRLVHSRVNSGRVEFIRGDILDPPKFGRAYDLIVTHFFLDCFRPDQLERIIAGLGASGTPEANWLIADFQTAKSGMRRVRSQLILWTMYTFFRAMTRLPAQQLTPPDLYMERAGFRLRRRFETEWGLLHSDWWRRVN